MSGTQLLDAVLTTMPTLFCFGLGFTGLALAHDLVEAGWVVAGTCRSAGKVAALQSDGIAAVRFDGTGAVAEISQRLSAVTHVLSAVPPDDEGDPVLHHHGADLAACAERIAWAGYLSTTGVYGDRGGEVVDETAELRPVGARGARRVAAEQAWCALWRNQGLPVHLFRLAGIYGPGRNALATVRSGKARRIVKPGQVFSRIHVDDIVQALRASIAQPNPGAAYNLSDDMAAPPQDVVTFACDLLGVDSPEEIPFDDAELSPMARSFYDESKRVSNSRIKDELGVRLRYPDYRVGLRALLDTGEGG